jgi:lipopolysaccharide/colanic/teichoic acid biosynthesis glycosyltransferase
MIRFFDFIFSFLGIIILSPLLVILFIIGYFDTGSPLFRQQRVGRNKVSFPLVKFRSMHLNTLSVPTHLANASSLTKYGTFLRKSKLDELPQLFNVLVGHMSLVGPRPNLLNQEDLIKIRESLGVYKIRPGITGLAQINQIDMSTPQLLAETDAKMASNFSTFLYFKFIIQTIFGKGSGDKIIQ